MKYIQDAWTYMWERRVILRTSLSFFLVVLSILALRAWISGPFQRGLPQHMVAKEKLHLRAIDALDYERMDALAMWLYLEHEALGIADIWAAPLLEEVSYYMRNGDRQALLRELVDGRRAEIDRGRVQQIEKMCQLALILQNDPETLIHLQKDLIISKASLAEFTKLGLSSIYADGLATEYSRRKEGLSLLCLLPSIEQKAKEVITSLHKKSVIVWEKEFSLDQNGSRQLLDHLYRVFTSDGVDEALLSKLENKLGDRNHPFFVGLVEWKSPKQKKKFLAHLKKRKVSSEDYFLSSSDSNIVDLAHMFFNENSLRHLSYAPEKLAPQLSSAFDLMRYRKNKGRVRYQDFCLDGGFVFGSLGYGEEMSDLRILHPRPLREIQASNFLQSSSRKGLAILYHPEKHYYFHGFKFATLSSFLERSRLGASREVAELSLEELFQVL